MTPKEWRRSVWRADERIRPCWCFSVRNYPLRSGQRTVRHAQRSWFYETGLISISVRETSKAQAWSASVEFWNELCRLIVLSNSTPLASRVFIRCLSPISYPSGHTSYTLVISKRSYCKRLSQFLWTHLSIEITIPSRTYQPTKLQTQNAKHTGILGSYEADTNPWFS